VAASRKPSEPSPAPRVTLAPHGDGVIASYHWKVFRFLLRDGSVLDVTPMNDDSDLRKAVLEHTKSEQIMGVAVLGDVVGPPARRVVKRS